MKQKIFAAIAAATVLLAGTPALALTQPQLDCPTQGTGKQGAEKLAMAMLTDDDGHASAIAEGDKLSAMVKTCMAQFKIADDLLGLYFDYSMHRISHDGYTTNVRLDQFDQPDVFLVHEWEGKPITRQHGGPVRMLIPQLYLWKSAKWIRRIEFVISDRPGFWEVRGYHNNADPWLEERYS